MGNTRLIWKDVLSLTIVTLISLNVLYFLFFFSKSYEKFTIQTELTVNAVTKVKYVYKNKYSEKRFFSEQKTISPNKPYLFGFDIPSVEEIDYIGLFWFAEKGSTINLSRYDYTINDKEYRSSKNRNLINYTSKGSFSKSNNKSVTVKSSNSKRNWIMLDDTGELNGKRDYKNHSFIPLIFNISIAVLLFFIILLRCNKVIFQFKKLSFSFQNIKVIILLIWVFIMPFWIIISHVLMITIVLITFFQAHIEKSFTELFQRLKGYVLFFALYFWVFISSFATSTISQVFNSALDYSYLLFMPIVFVQLDNKKLIKILTYFEKGLLVYFILFFTFTISNFLKFQPDYSFFKFMEINLELFWHTSYLSVFILIIFISKIKEPIKNNLSLVLFYIAALIFMYVVNARIPFLVGILLVLTNFFRYLKNKLIKISFILLTIGFSLALTFFFLVKEPLKNNKNHNSIDSLDARTSIWKSSFTEIKNNIIFGVGKDNTVDAISKSMSNFTATKFRNYNCHNQFLEIFLAHGTLAIILFIGILFTLYNKKSIYAKSFVVTCVILFFVESYLQRQAGMVLFTFWYCFFLNFQDNKHEISFK